MRWAIACGAILSALIPASASQFNFAGFTFDQINTPDRGAMLGTNAQLGGAQFSSGLPTTTTATISFPQSGSGFDPSRTLPHLTGLNTNGIRAINLPNGNNGTSTRHGVEVWWSNGHGIPNLSGEDFVIYESGSTSNAVEGLMARVYTNGSPGAWSDWFYFSPDSFQITSTPEVGFAFGFDLSDMGVSANTLATRIQLANLIATDRISTTNATDLGGGVSVGQGKVVFDSSSNLLPDAGLFDSDRRFTTPSADLDPDPFYIASLHNVCESSAPTLSFVSQGGNTILSWPAPSCYTLQSSGLLTPASWNSIPETALLTNDTYKVTIANTNSSRFFRLTK